MRLADLSRELKKYNKGSFIRVGYTTDLTSSMKASQKKLGHKVQKKVEKTVRLGCDYHNMKATIEAKENGRGTRYMYEEPVIDNILYQNKKTDALYLRVGTTPNANAKTVYLIDGIEATAEELAEMLVPSYFNKKGSAPEVQNIKLENVLYLGSND